jgi:hypothetical protein
MFLDDFWEEVCRQKQRTRLVPEQLVAARRTFERRWGCHNLEVPVSHVCRTAAFAEFMAHLLGDLPRFHEVFNEAVRAYRKTHGLRSRTHPFPELVRDGEWFEAPLWAWRQGNPVRRRLFVRRTERGLLLRLDGQSTAPEDPGLKLRPRAVTTALFARLFVADLFLHGIGGARYDEVTDAVIARFYGVDPPPYLIVSGTLRLPLPTYPARPDDARRLAREIRDLEWNPQRHLDPQTVDQAARERLAARQEWVKHEPGDHEGRRQRCLEIRRLNAELAPLLEADRQRLIQQLQHVRAELAANKVLRRRDWAFCLYPEKELRDFCTQGLAHQS